MFFFLTLILTLFIGALGKLSFVILHMNDIRGNVAEVTFRNTVDCPEKLRGTKACIGGLSRAVTVINDHREEEKKRLIQKVIYLNTGNDFTGSIWFREYKEKILADFMKLLKPDALNVGAREFRYGEKLLANYLKLLSGIPIISTNINTDHFHLLQPFLEKHLVIDIFGVPVGIVSFVTPDVEWGARLTKINEELESLYNETTKLHDMGVSIIIAVGTSSWEILERIAVEVPHVNIVIGGQCTYLQWNLKQGSPPEQLPIHSPYPKVIKQLRKNVLLAVTPGLSRYIGRLNVTFDDNGVLMDYEAAQIYLNSRIPQDPGGLNILKKYQDQILKREGVVIAQSKVVFKGESNSCVFKDCNYGNIMTDAMVDWAGKDSLSPEYWTACPIALYPSGHLSGHIDPTVTENHIIESQIYDSLPFNDTIVTCSIVGGNLKQVLENSVVNEDMTSLRVGGFLQVSGIKFVFSMVQSIGARVSEVRIRCGNCWVPKYMNLVPTAVYNIVTIKDMLDGEFDNVALNQHAFNRRVYSEDALSVLINYLKKLKPPCPQEEGRIVDNTANDTSCGYQLFQTDNINKFIFPFIVMIFLCLLLHV